MEKKKFETIMMTKDERIEADPRGLKRVTLGSGSHVFVTRQAVEIVPTTETAESDMPAEQLKPWHPYPPETVFDARREREIIVQKKEEE